MLNKLKYQGLLLSNNFYHELNLNLYIQKKGRIIIRKSQIFVNQVGNTGRTQSQNRLNLKDLKLKKHTKTLKMQCTDNEIFPREFSNF